MEAVARHYERAALIAAIRDGLLRAGKDLSALAPADLAAVDEFHVRGRAATLELARQMGLTAAMRVLDIGSGLGGPARLLAAEYGCRVTGLDLTAAFVAAARELARWVGLAERVDFHEGDALAMPFGDEAFDAAVTQHVAMNIADKAALYREAWRVLKPGARFGLYDVVQGEGGEVVFPVPWARLPETSFLADAEMLRELLVAEGFVIESWRDTSELGRVWFQRLAETLAGGGPPPLGFHLILGPDFAQMAANQRQNLAEGRIALVEVVCRKP